MCLRRYQAVFMHPMDDVTGNMEEMEEEEEEGGRRRRR